MKKPIVTLVGAPLALLAVLLIPTSCGSANPEEAGYDAMQAGNHSKAIGLLGEALKAAEPGSKKAHELSVARCQSLAHEDPKACQEEFLGLTAKGLQLNRKDFEDVATALMSVTAYEQAAHVVDKGIKTYPDSTRLPEYLTKLKSLAESGEAPGLGATLTGLGYGGE
ncbi:MAG: hypothetical protein P1V35_03955 [Planctomycetota bacterium]|nr:hypothetical protein [Planctomycetota bacterium]